MHRFALISVLTGVLVVGVASSAASPQLSPPKAAVTADAYVSKAANRRNFGRARVLRTQRQPASRVYLRFDLRSLSEATITKATLRVYALGSTRGRFTVRSTSGRWSERGITFRNAPRPGSSIAASGRVRRGFLSIDVTRAAKAGEVVNLVLTSSRGLVRLASRESGRAPRLDLVLQPTLIAAGDIADCTPGAQQTAALVDTIPGTVAALGDLAYENGTAQEFANCYEPTWGRFKARTKPAAGNHEYGTAGASGYFGYWGAVAGNSTQGWYSYDLGAWHVVVLNSNCVQVGGCDAGSPQGVWLRADLASRTNRCTVAYWHHPLFSTGLVGESSSTKPLFQALFDADADLVLVGHSHTYQRWAPLTPDGVVDPARGIRQFVVGTGGRFFHDVGTPVAGQEMANNDTFGVLRLTLRSTSYDWQFMPVAGRTFTDSGSQTCH